MSQLEAYEAKSNDELHYIIHDATEAALAMGVLGDREAEGKYLDQVNDACTVLYRRKQEAA